MMNDGKKQEPPLFLDIPFGEALTRFARTKPEEVAVPPGKTPKVAKAAKRLSALSLEGPKAPKEKRRH